MHSSEDRWCAVQRIGGVQFRGLEVHSSEDRRCTVQRIGGAQFRG